MNNSISIYNQCKEDSIRGFCYNGMVLGDWINKKCGVVKTFISIEEMKVNQFAEYFDYLRNKLYVDMFRCRKGTEAILDSEFTEYIPDTYFEYKEINNFLLKLENPFLIMTHRKCVEYYSEHKLEVDKCTKMLDAIMDNSGLNISSNNNA